MVAKTSDLAGQCAGIWWSLSMLVVDRAKKLDLAAGLMAVSG